MVCIEFLDNNPCPLSNTIVLLSGQGFLSRNSIHHTPKYANVVPVEINLGPSWFNLKDQKIQNVPKWSPFVYFKLALLQSLYILIFVHLKLALLLSLAPDNSLTKLNSMTTFNFFIYHRTIFSCNSKSLQKESSCPGNVCSQFDWCSALYNTKMR